MQPPKSEPQMSQHLNTTPVLSVILVILSAHLQELIYLFLQFPTVFSLQFFFFFLIHQNNVLGNNLSSLTPQFIWQNTESKQLSCFSTPTLPCRLIVMGITQQNRRIQSINPCHTSLHCPEIILHIPPVLSVTMANILSCPPYFSSGNLVYLSLRISRKCEMGTSSQIQKLTVSAPIFSCSFITIGKFLFLLLNILLHVHWI